MAEPVGGTLVLSPHADDVALSVGGSLHHGVFRRPITLATLFGRSNFVRGRFSPDWRSVTDSRREEDKAFATSLNADLRYFELAEATLRPSEGKDRIFARTAEEPMAVPASLTSALQQLLAAVRPDTLLIPLGLGCHRDHLLTQREGTALGRKATATIVYYEDLPYAAQLSNRKVRKHARTIDPDVRPMRIDIRATLKEKLRSVSLYRTQMASEKLMSAVEEMHRSGRSQVCEWIWTLGAD
jgi:2'-N-acetylparomamine deacetylase / 2'''-acetyl-6'''-hydroxyneomycin deacetylase